MHTFAREQPTTQSTASIKPTLVDHTRPSQGHKPGSILHLERVSGNQAALRLLGDTVDPAEMSTALSATGIQAKLMVGAPGDRFEEEADRIADTVMAMPDSEMLNETRAADSSALSVTRCTCDSSEDELHPQLDHGQAGPVSDGTASLVHDVVRSPGHPLDTPARTFFEPRFQWDLGVVRVHSDETAAASARVLGARAYTLGRHIVFGAGHWAPGTDSGRRLLAHELVHVAQQTSDTMTRVGAEPPSLLTPHQPVEATVQCDFALDPPHPAAAGRVLTAGEMAGAIAFNNRVIGAGGADLIREVRDVLGTSPDPAVVDEDFVNAVVTWQAVQGLSQDGQLGPVTAHSLFREIGAEKAGECKCASGVEYAPAAPVAVPDGGGGETTHFAFDADFESDPAAGVFPSCCEVRQFIRWNAAAAAGMPGGVPHGGFPAGTPVDTFIEDRDAANKRYGHRSGALSDPQPFDQYLDSTGARNQAFGEQYRGTDDPSVPPAMAVGQWQFFVKVIDVCNGGVPKGKDSVIRINW